MYICSKPLTKAIFASPNLLLMHYECCVVAGVTLATRSYLRIVFRLLSSQWWCVIYLGLCYSLCKPLEEWRQRLNYIILCRPATIVGAVVIIVVVIVVFTGAWVKVNTCSVSEWSLLTQCDEAGNWITSPSWLVCRRSAWVGMMAAAVAITITTIRN